VRDESQIDRRDFLTKLINPTASTSKNSPLVVRPPYGVSESIFQSECILCEDKPCVASCDEQIIVIDKDDTPILDFREKGCTFCQECSEACKPDVLRLLDEDTKEHINADFRISIDGCVAHHGVVCFSCKEPCIDDAILFNGMFNPVIDMDICTSCGYCMARCPTKAISYSATAMRENLI
jgi:ferredoxin-type protein NapF